MWDPRSFEDTDYGLAPGETFEPEDAWAAYDDIGTDVPHIMTVLGPIEPGELGMCLVHEHLLAKLGKDADHQLDSVPFAQEEVEAWVARGGRAIVEATTEDSGRDVAGLLRIATVVPVHLIAATGSLHGSTVVAEDLGVTWADEIRHGIGQSGVRAGMIVIGVGQGASELWSAAAVAHQQTGTPIYLSGGTSSAQVDAVAALVDAGVDVHHLIAGGRRQDEEMDDQVALAGTDAWLAFDGITDVTARESAGRLAALVDAGLGGQLLLSHGHDRRSRYIAYGGHPGITYIQEIFLLQLMEAGVGAEAIRELLIGNPARALVTMPRETASDPAKGGSE